MPDDSHLASAPVVPAESTPEGCPTPLAWQQVVDAVRQEAVPHEVEVQGVRTTAVSIGQGPPLYLLPGFLGDHELFALPAWLLREEFCCMLVDPPECPLDRRRAPDVLLDQWTDSIVHLAENLGHERLHVYGAGLGGLLALRMMVRHAHRLQSVALHCAFGRLKLSLVERCLVSSGTRSRRALGELRIAMRIQQQNHRHWFPPFDPTRWEFFAANIAATPVRDAALRTGVAGRVDLRKSLAQATTPTLLIQSEGEGRAALAADCELLQCLPQAHVEKLENTGRLPHITHPHRLVKLLRPFWEQTS